MRIGYLFAAFFLLIGFCAAGQPAAETPAAETELETTGQTVKVDGEATDAEIARRLGDILAASRRYEDLSVEVRDGIVFIAGTAQSDDHKQWASDLARRTEDAVAVVNNLEVVPPPVVDQHSIRADLLAIWRSLLRSLPLIGLGFMLLVLSVLAAIGVTKAVSYPLQAFVGSALLRNVIRKLIGLLVVIGGAVLFLQISGLTGIALTVVSGTGLAGLIVGFAFRDIAENFLASVLLSVQTPFRLGDVIEVAGYTGVAQKVTPRGTVLIDFDGNHVTIANSTVYKSTLKNLTANPKMRANFDVGIGYDASIKRAQSVAMSLLREHPAVLDDPEPMVLVDTLGSSTINLKVYFWIDGHKHSLLKIKSAVMRRTLRSIERAGISLPDEAREIIFPQGVPFRPGDGAGSAPGPVGPSDEVVGADLEESATDAEGDLTSEVQEIRRQAEASRAPEAGPDIMAETPQ
ncbi:MAG: mechanosensitive ion channel family protein [Planctomycetota bacterium]